MPKPRSLAVLTIALVMSAPALAGQSASICRDAEGRPVFSDQGCPEGTSDQGRHYLPSAQGYSGKESLDTDVLNNYERRYGTGNSWQWQDVPAAGGR